MVEKKHVIPRAFLVEATPLFRGNSLELKGGGDSQISPRGTTFGKTLHKPYKKTPGVANPKLHSIIVSTFPRYISRNHHQPGPITLAVKRILTAFNFSPHFPLDFAGGTRTYLGWKMFFFFFCTATKIREFRVKDWEYFIMSLFGLMVWPEFSHRVWWLKL